MSEYIPVPVEEARRIADECDKSQVIIVCWDAEFGRTHVTTYGKSLNESMMAATGGNRIKEALGWPETMLDARPEWMTQDGWVNANDRLPELRPIANMTDQQSDICLVAVPLRSRPDKLVTKVARYLVSDGGMEMFSGWVDVTHLFGRSGLNVRYWMPLPQKREN